MTIQIDVISDAICPWCWVGKRRLEKALALEPDLDVEVVWRPYQLAPGLPDEGLPRDTYLQAKFGDLDQVRQSFGKIAEMGKAEGIAFDFDAIKKTPNTMGAHKLIRWALGAGHQDAVVEGLFRRYFEQGADIGDPEVLVSAAAEAGLDGALVRELLEKNADQEQVEHELEVARRMGIQSVPTFIFDQKFAVVGAESPARMAAALRHCLKTRAQAAAH